MKLETTTINIYNDGTTPQDGSYIFVRFENGFCCIGTYHEATKDIFCGGHSYHFTTVKTWFEIPIEAM